MPHVNYGNDFGMESSPESAKDAVLTLTWITTVGNGVHKEQT